MGFAQQLLNRRIPIDRLEVGEVGGSNTNVARRPNRPCEWRHLCSCQGVHRWGEYVETRDSFVSVAFVFVLRRDETSSAKSSQQHNELIRLTGRA